MKKAINMALQIQPGEQGAPPEAISAALQQAFEQANPGLKLAVKQITPTAQDGLTAQVYIEGDQEPVADFSTIAEKALQNSGRLLNNDANAEGANLTLSNIHELDVIDSDDNNSLVLSPAAAQAEAQPEKTLDATAATLHDQTSETIAAEPAVVANAATEQTPTLEQPVSEPTAQNSSAMEQAPSGEDQAAAPQVPSAEAAIPAAEPATAGDAPAKVAASSSPTKLSRNKRKKHRK